MLDELGEWAREACWAWAPTEKKAPIHPWLHNKGQLDAAFPCPLGRHRSIR